MAMLAKFRHVDWGLVLVLAFVFCVGIAVLQFVNEIGDAERGLILYEQSCPLNAETNASPKSPIALAGYENNVCSEGLRPLVFRRTAAELRNSMIIPIGY